MEQQHVQGLKRRAQEQDEGRHEQEFGPVAGQNRLGCGLAQKVHEAAHIGDEPDFDHGHHDR